MDLKFRLTRVNAINIVKFVNATDIEIISKDITNYLGTSSFKNLKMLKF